jgi:SNF2 family DNA or RNA helicase
LKYLETMTTGIGLPPDSECNSGDDKYSIFSSDADASMPTSPERPDGKEDDSQTPGSARPLINHAGQEASVRRSKNHVALGAIRVRDEADSDVLKLDSCICIAGPHSGTPIPCSKLDDLVQRGWVLTDVVENARHARHHSIRLSVITENIERTQRRRYLMECRKLLKHVLAYVDKSKQAWEGDWGFDTPFESYLVCPQQESLFYLFNTLPSPSPAVKGVTDVHSRRGMEDILDNSVAGLQTSLYSYQQRSAAVMIQRETSPKKAPDPRKPCFYGPTGQSFHYDKEEGILLLAPSLYEEPRGGILAETMGYGKTLICLAVILATKGHYSRVPEDRVEVPKPARPSVASLAEMAAARIIDDCVPWKAEFHDLARRGYHHDRCVDILRSSFKKYTERLLTPQTPNRNGKRRTEKGVRLCSTTLIIVPPNLLVQWQHEIEKHTEKGSLQVLILNYTCKVIPRADQLASYDIVLITKGRLDQEYRDDDLNTGKRPRDSELYQSPLTDLRWLRVILDEGAGFSSTPTRTNAMAMLDKMYFDRRWVVSGTPSNSLRGVEVGLAANETMSDEEAAQRDLQNTLRGRRESDVLDREGRDLDKLRMIVTRFLKAQPWTNMPGIGHANWSRYLSPYDNRGQRRNVMGLRALLESIIVRHTIGDIEADLSLPPLHNKVVYLEPSFYDKLSINLFSAVLVSNAVTSERSDEDYMFHPKNRKQLDLLINNLRQSSFHWVGFKKHDIEEPVRISKKYLEENVRTISESDRNLLINAIEAGERALSHPGWLAFSTLHEIGVFVEDFPKQASESWALGRPSNPLLLGTVQARAVQKYIEEHAGDDDPTEGLPGAGLRAMQIARKRAADEDKTAAKNQTAGSQLIEEPKIKDQTKSKRKVKSTDKSPTKGSRLDQKTLPPNSPLHNTNIIGFSSSKLSYLTDQILLHHSTSKIIIFYDTNNVAFWLAEALELLSLPFLIYANTLPQSVRSTYLSLFNSSPTIRILLMDLRQASHGLHIAAANRVYIVNPIWQPNVEAQAIKRAHRIGQTKPVFVETLVLRDTLEDRMLRRRREMSNAELRRAERSLLDDGAMNRIIQDEAFLPFDDREVEVQGQLARLRTPQCLFGRGSAVDGLVGNAEASSGLAGLDQEAEKSTPHPEAGTAKRVKIAAFESRSGSGSNNAAVVQDKSVPVAVRSAVRFS